MPTSVAWGGLSSHRTKPLALPHSHTLLAATVSGRPSHADAHTATEQWHAKPGTLALGFWNNATTAFSDQPMSPDMATTRTSSTTATMLTEPPRDAKSGATLRRGRPPDMAKQPAFRCCIDLTFSYLWSDKSQLARPPDDKQSPKPSSRSPDDKRSHELRGRISKIPEGQPYGAATRTAQTQDTDS